MIAIDNSNTLLDISTIANRYGVTLRALRFYEAQGLISPTRSGITRLYSPKDCIRLQLILKGKKLGFTLREIDELIRRSTSITTGDDSFITDRMTGQQMKDQLAALCDRRARIDVAIGELQAALERGGED